MSRFLQGVLGWDSAAPAAAPPSLPKNPRGYCDFRPQLFFQEVQAWHLAGSALEFRMNISTGVNEARFANEANLERPGSEIALQSAVRHATTLVQAAESTGDEEEVTTRLVNAVTWQDPRQVEYILRSCYVTHPAALPALGEACYRGLEECVQILLQAGVSAAAYFGQTGGSSCQKNALHIACENGHESCAVLLINSMQSKEDILLKTIPSDLNAFDILRRQDLSGMAKRLELHAENHFLKFCRGT